MALEPFETAEAEDFPTCRQLSVFVENRVGQLLTMLRIFEGSSVRILAISVVHSVDCAIVRLVVNLPDEAIELLKKAGFAVSIADLIVVELPPGETGLRRIASALLRAEVNMHYAYPLFTRPATFDALALKVDNLEMAADVLVHTGVRMLGETDLHRTSDDGPGFDRGGNGGF